MGTDRRSPKDLTPSTAINVFKDATGGVVEVDDIVSSFGCTAGCHRTVATPVIGL